MIFERTCDELRRMAYDRLRQGERDALLDTTALVHECFVRFSNAGQLDLSDRTHFFRYAGQAMRFVLHDPAFAALRERPEFAPIGAAITPRTGPPVP